MNSKLNEMGSANDSGDVYGTSSNVVAAAAHFKPR